MSGQMPKVYEGDLPYVFACYAHADRDAALPIIRALTGEGYRVWYDDGIELATVFPEYIADHIHGCDCFVMLVSRASLASDWCMREVYYALELNKTILPIYLEDVELTRGLRMSIGAMQALFWHELEPGEFYRRLFDTPALAPCLTDKGVKLRQSKKLLVQRARKVLAAGKCGKEDLEDVLERLRELSKSSPRRDEEVERLMHRLEERIADEREKEEQRREEERRREEEQPATPAGDAPEESYDDVEKQQKEDVKPRSSSVAITAVIIIAAVLMLTVIIYGFSQIDSILRKNAPQQTSELAPVNDTGVATSDNGGAQSDAGSVTPDNGSAEHDASVEGVDVKSALNDYSWDELKQLAVAISKASDGEWPGIAKAYNLVDGDGKLQGDEKTFTLDDDTKTSVRILGFRHDELAGGGRAGISFEFADAPVAHSMNTTDTNEGGWEGSEMRGWLNSEFLGRLPLDLQERIEAVKKEVNNDGAIESEDDVSVVTPIDDSLWLLSVSEVYGHIDGVWSSATYDAEGVQYKLYADKGVTVENHGFCGKHGENSWWWLRSPDTYLSFGFHGVYDDGDWRWNYANGVLGISPGFCF